MKKITIFFLFSLLCVRFAFAATSVPHRFHFQSVFYDTGGNPLSTGSYTARFSILDQSSQPVYTEEQQVDLVNGVVSTMIGDGFMVGSNLATPIGGILANVINPNQKYYLQAEIQGDTHTLEIGSVPYAHFSEEALSVSAGGITSEAIAEKTITRHHLSDELESAIFGSIAGDRLPASMASSTDLQNHINARSNAHPAQAISVVGPFANSNSISVEGTLGDFDRAIELQGHNLDAAISGLQSRIDTVNTTLQSQIISVNTNLQSQIDRKFSVDGGTLNGSVNMQGHGITSLSDPSGSGDAATKNYTDSSVGSLRTSLMSYVDSAVGSLRADLTAPTGGVQPQVVAAGIVLNYGDGISLSGRYNFSGFDGCTISFSAPIATPYIVQITPRDLGLSRPLSVRAISSSGFEVKYGDIEELGCDPVSFNFVVFK